MKREEIKSIFPDATDEQLKSIMDINGNDVEKAKGKASALEAELKEKQTAFDNLSAEFNKLKEGSATAEEFKTKYEQLQNEIAEKEKAAKAEAEKKEKETRIMTRFNAVVGDKKFSHEAVKADYLRKFTEALDNADNAGKSDADILHNLTKDDAGAFVGVQVTKLRGSQAGQGEVAKSKEDILSIKNGSERREAMAAALQTNPNFFD